MGFVEGFTRLGYSPGELLVRGFLSPKVEPTILFSLFAWLHLLSLSLRLPLGLFKSV